MAEVGKTLKIRLNQLNISAVPN